MAAADTGTQIYDARDDGRIDSKLLPGARHDVDNCLCDRQFANLQVQLLSILGHRATGQALRFNIEDSIGTSWQTGTDMASGTM